MTRASARSLLLYRRLSALRCPAQERHRPRPRLPGRPHLRRRRHAQREPRLGDDQPLHARAQHERGGLERELDDHVAAGRELRRRRPAAGERLPQDQAERARPDGVDRQRLPVRVHVRPPDLPAAAEPHAAGDDLHRDGRCGDEREPRRRLRDLRHLQHPLGGGARQPRRLRRGDRPQGRRPLRLARQRRRPRLLLVRGQHGLRLQRGHRPGDAGRHRDVLEAERPRRLLLEPHALRGLERRLPGLHQPRHLPPRRRGRRREPGLHDRERRLREPVPGLAARLLLHEDRAGQPDGHLAAARARRSTSPAPAPRTRSST